MTTFVAIGATLVCEPAVDPGLAIVAATGDTEEGIDATVGADGEVGCAGDGVGDHEGSLLAGSSAAALPLPNKESTCEYMATLTCAKDKISIGWRKPKMLINNSSSSVTKLGLSSSSSSNNATGSASTGGRATVVPVPVVSAVVSGVSALDGSDDDSDDTGGDFDASVAGAVAAAG